MKIELFKKIIKGIFKIFKILKKGNKEAKTKMPDNTGNTQTQVITGINANTPVVFTIKSFLATIGTILGLFIGFYTLVIVPNLKKSEDHQKEMYQEQKEFIIGEFNELKNGQNENRNAINLNTNAINATNERFRDLNESVEDIANSGGGFGSVTVSDTSSHN